LPTIISSTRYLYTLS